MVDRVGRSPVVPHQHTQVREFSDFWDYLRVLVMLLLLGLGWNKMLSITKLLLGAEIKGKLLDSGCELPGQQAARL